MLILCLMKTHAVLCGQLGQKILKMREVLNPKGGLLLYFITEAEIFIFCYPINQSHQLKTSYLYTILTF